jgi:hypothetical protein
MLSEEFKKKYPNLSKEIEKGENKTKINLTRKKSKPKRKFTGYNPNEIDFIRRCMNLEEAKEIITYLEKREEISPERAKELRIQLKVEGLRSFGMIKSKGYYERER